MLQYLIALLCLVATWFWMVSRPSRLPPGPLCLPMLKNMMTLNGDFVEIMSGLHKKYGAMFSLSLAGGGVWDVWIEGYDVIKEMINDSRFLGRAVYGPMEDLRMESGVIFGNGVEWKQKRNTMLQILGALGMGKTAFSAAVEVEIEHLINHLEADIGKPVYIFSTMSFVTNNVISTLLFNKRSEFDDEEFLGFHHRITEYISMFDAAGIIWIVPDFISKRLPQRKRMLKIRKEIVGFCRGLYNEREKFADQEPECASDYLWQHFKTDSKEGHPFPKEQIAETLTDFFLAGQETTTTTLAWLFLNLMHKPEVRQKINEELQREFPDRTEIIPYEANVRLPYLMACIQEVLRFTPPLLSTLDHTALVDVDNFHGFRIPKGSRVFANLMLLNRDEKLWKDASSFNPENFLDETGAFVKSPHLLVFSAGARACPGDKIAYMELLMVAANILRRFEVQPADQNVGIPSLKAVVGTVNSPVKYEVLLKPTAC